MDNDNDITQLLRSNATALEADEVLRAPPSALMGVSPAAETALAAIDIDAVTGEVHGEMLDRTHLTELLDRPLDVTDLDGRPLVGDHFDVLDALSLCPGLHLACAARGVPQRGKPARPIDTDEHRRTFHGRMIKPSHHRVQPEWFVAPSA